MTRETTFSDTTATPFTTTDSNALMPGVPADGLQVLLEPSNVAGPPGVHDDVGPGGDLPPPGLPAMVAEGTTVRLPLTSLVSGSAQRSGRVDVDDLVVSFKHTPQLHPITVRHVKDDPDRYEVIAGHRRLEAARQLGHTDIEAMVFDDVDDATAEAWGIEENLRRKAVADERGAVARLLELYALKQGGTGHGGDRRSKDFAVSSGQDGHLVQKSPTKQVAELTGKSERTVRRHKANARGVTEGKKPPLEGIASEDKVQNQAADPLEEQLAAFHKAPKVHQETEFKRAKAGLTQALDALDCLGHGGLTQEATQELRALASQVMTKLQGEASQG